MKIQWAFLCIRNCLLLIYYQVSQRHQSLKVLQRLAFKIQELAYWTNDVERLENNAKIIVLQICHSRLILLHKFFSN